MGQLDHVAAAIDSETASHAPEDPVRRIGTPLADYRVAARQTCKFGFEQRCNWSRQHCIQACNLGLKSTVALIRH